MSLVNVDACIVGGGPSGSVAAIRLAQLGYRICIIEKCRFPRRHVGESITPGIWSIINLLGLEDTFLKQDFYTETLGMTLGWSEPNVEFSVKYPRQRGLLVDRERFDSFWISAAENIGVQVYQPAQILSSGLKDDTWQLNVKDGSKSFSIRASFLVDASGRKGLIRGKRELFSPRLLGLCGYVEPLSDIVEPLVEALPDGWCWGAPVSKEKFSAIVFMDPQSLKDKNTPSIEGLWRTQLKKSRLFKRVSEQRGRDRVTVLDASAYYDSQSMGAKYIKVGEASFSLDPISSTGIEKAMQSGLIAATVLHTMLLDPSKSALCSRFYRQRLHETVSLHASWAASYYSNVHGYGELPFWKTRSKTDDLHYTNTSVKDARKSYPIEGIKRLKLAREIVVCDTPCIVGNEITLRKAVSIPNFLTPVIFVEDIEVANLLELVTCECSLDDLLALWQRHVSPQKARTVLGWSLKQRLLQADWQ
jgi:flavin-dependent dehydrogenase